jgi:hypothetical protein
MKPLLSVAALLAMTAGSAMAQLISNFFAPPDEFLNTLAFEEVQKDLGISDEVASRLRLLYDEYRAALLKTQQGAGLIPGVRPNDLTREQQQRLVESRQGVAEEFTPKAKELLSDDQRRRIQQISVQRKWNQNAPAALLSEYVAPELKLTTEQRQTLFNLFREQEGTIVGPEALAQRRKEYREKAIDVLTEEQKETLKTLKGKEFDVSRLVRPLARQVKGK